MRSIIGCDNSDYNPNLLTGEGTPENIYLPGVASRAKQVSPNALIIAITRDPIDRAVSHYNMARRSKKIDGRSYEKFGTFKESIVEELECYGLDLGMGGGRVRSEMRR